MVQFFNNIFAKSFMKCFTKSFVKFRIFEYFEYYSIRISEYTDARTGRKKTQIHSLHNLWTR